MAIKINSLELENVKRVKALTLEPSENGLTIIGGKNRQGKTSVLDAIAWALGGNRFRPSNPKREGSVTDPYLKVELSNGLIVERKGKNSDLKVTDPSGEKAGQALLDSFISELALNLPKFMEASNKEKASTLLRVIGVEDELLDLEKIEQKLYDERHAMGRISDQKLKHANELPYVEGLPEVPISVSELIKEQQAILARNGENQQKRMQAKQITENYRRKTQEIEELEKQIADLKQKLSAAESDLVILKNDMELANKTAEQLEDESTEELEQNIQNAEEINSQIQQNMKKKEALDEAAHYKEKWKELDASLSEVRKEKFDLLNSADLPLPGLSVEDGNLTYNGQQWDNMSGAEQLKVATAIVRKLNPDCGFVLLDKLEAMDQEELKEFGLWLTKEGLQVIATRVSTGEECTLIIEDGKALGNKKPAAKISWEKGKF